VDSATPDYSAASVRINVESNICPRVAVVATYWRGIDCGLIQKSAVPDSTIIVSPIAPCAIATRNDTRHVFVPTRAPLQRACIVPLVHVLNCIKAHDTTVGRGIVAMENVVRGILGQEGFVGRSIFPADLTAHNG